MKQIKWLFFATAVLLLLSACGGGEEPETAVSDTTSDTVPNPPTPEPAATPTLAPPVVVVEGEGGGEEPVAAPEVVEEKIRPWPADKFGYGVQVHGNATVGGPGLYNGHGSKSAWFGLGYKMQLQWWQVHPSPGADQWFFYDGVIDEAANHNLNLMVSVVWFARLDPAPQATTLVRQMITTNMPTSLRNSSIVILAKLTPLKYGTSKT